MVYGVLSNQVKGVLNSIHNLKLCVVERQELIRLTLLIYSLTTEEKEKSNGSKINVPKIYPVR